MLLGLELVVATDLSFASIFMECRGSGVRVSLAPFLNPFHRKGSWGAERLLFFLPEKRLTIKLSQDSGLFYGRNAPPAFSRLSVAFCGVSPIPIEATGGWLK